MSKKQESEKKEAPRAGIPARYFVAKGRKIFCLGGKLLEGAEVFPKYFGGGDVGQKTIDDFFKTGVLEKK